MKLTKIATVLLFLSPAYLSAATQDFTYRNGYKITADQASPEVNIRIKDNKPTQSISTPNSNGISHNYFTEFNVGKRGLNIDNAPSARVIINEVTGDNISRLRGEIAVTGKQASVVIANPNGVNCNSCSTSDISQLTLLAGNTIPDTATGKLTGFKNITSDIIVRNVKKDAIKSKLTLTGHNVEINKSDINTTSAIINVGINHIDFSKSLQSQIADVNLNVNKENYDAYTRPGLFIDGNTTIRTSLTINANNAALVNNGKVYSGNINLNLMNSEFSNDNYLKASKININSKDSGIYNSQHFSADNVNVNYSKDFKIHNKTISSDADTTFYAGNISISSKNVKKYYQPNSWDDSYRYNKLAINNDSTFIANKLRITGGEYDHMRIDNDGKIHTGEFKATGNLLTMFNYGDMTVSNNFDVKDTDKFNDRGSNKIIILQEGINI
ncbi:filamentous hemagglutinin N-terminal domain-containing protein [Vibrio parahaemolyticus]|uniref:two-partner secretion domain-containing protein n=1 Tax=Vibrio parahaemolyticus TaxID=670 RepID=UPI001EEC0C7D|nr:filamentous hemagglutinin N-terminal domain-containing protein [Vibrio parahaemolyticus]MCG6489684.1 filamentous hemagglutinin N-terminal domain-containing protein [Vibrio parahaemolyticus]